MYESHPTVVGFKWFLDQDRENHASFLPLFSLVFIFRPQRKVAITVWIWAREKRYNVANLNLKPFVGTHIKCENATIEHTRLHAPISPKFFSAMMILLRLAQLTGYRNRLSRLGKTFYNHMLHVVLRLSWAAKLRISGWGPGFLTVLSQFTAAGRLWLQKKINAFKTC